MERKNERKKKTKKERKTEKRRKKQTEKQTNPENKTEKKKEDVKNDAQHTGTFHWQQSSVSTAVRSTAYAAYARNSTGRAINALLICLKAVSCSFYETVSLPLRTGK